MTHSVEKAPRTPDIDPHQMLIKFQAVRDKISAFGTIQPGVVRTAAKGHKMALDYMILRHHRNNANNKGPDLARLPIRRPASGAHFR